MHVHLKENLVLTLGVRVDFILNLFASDNILSILNVFELSFCTKGRTDFGNDMMQSLVFKLR